MNYIEITFSLKGKKAFTHDIITAYLSEIDFESFTEDIYNLYCYIPESKFDEHQFSEVVSDLQQIVGECSVSKKEIPYINWNQKWESQFEPVFVDDFCVVRAPFHENFSGYTYSITIAPKMSFGTGHHETTFLILQYISQLDIAGKKVADCGCGTGVLGILAAKCGAHSVFAFDNDPICYENTIENSELNQVNNVFVECGNLQLLREKYDIVCANINRNVLIAHMAILSESLYTNGILIMSGFYEKDMPLVKEHALQNKLKFVYYNTKNNWTITVFSKE
ncbi:MAG: 50S ribosomal protein L11 methyltransferase [Bacteroidales bacterium]